MNPTSWMFLILHSLSFILHNSVHNKIVRTIYSAGNERDEVEINHLQNVATDDRFVELAQIEQLEQFTQRNLYPVMFEVMLISNFRIDIVFGVFMFYVTLVPI